MIEFTEYRTHITIDLEPGIWVFDNESTTGKSRLCKCLRDLELLGQPACGYSYEDMLLGRDLHNILTCGKYRVIMLDRYDMYPDAEHAEICECAKNTVVLLVCMRGFKGSNTDEVCFIDMSESSIKVYS